MRRLLSVLCFSSAFAFAIANVNAAAQSAPSVVQQSSAPAEGSSVQKQSVTAYTLSPEKYETAIAYSRATYRLHFLGAAYSLVLLWIILSLRLAPGFRDLAERVSRRRRFVQAIVFVPLLIFTFEILKSPLDAYRHHLDTRYGISVQGWGSWVLDWSKGELLKLIFATVLAYILYGVIRRSPRRWWLYFGLASVPILIFLQFISPVIIEPLFYKYDPLAVTQPSLVEQIEKEVQHSGLSIPRERMFEMKASEKLNAIDAYVTGFGSSTRIVILDTTIAKMPAAQTLFVVGHEIGHYVLGHIPKGIAFSGALIVVLLLFSHLGVTRLLTRRERRWSIRGLDDWASLPAIMLFVYLFFFLAEPATNSFSRYQEHQADVYGLEVIHGLVPDSSQTAAEAFQTLGEVDLADPNPSTFMKVWFFSHPPLAERLAFARDYDPWGTGQTPMFVH